MWIQDTSGHFFDQSGDRHRHDGSRVGVAVASKGGTAAWSLPAGPYHVWAASSNSFAVATMRLPDVDLSAAMPPRASSTDMGERMRHDADGRRGDSADRRVSLIELLVGIAIMGVISTMLLMALVLAQRLVFVLHQQRERPRQRQAGVEPSPARDPVTRRSPRSRAAPPLMRSCTARGPTPSRSSRRSTKPATHHDGRSPIAVSSTPHLVVYRLYTDGELWRFEDLDNDRVIDMSNGDSFDMLGSTPPEFELQEQRLRRRREASWSPTWRTGRLSPHTPVFSYNVYGTDPDTGATVLQTEEVLFGADRYTGGRRGDPTCLSTSTRRAHPCPPICGPLRSCATTAERVMTDESEHAHGMRHGATS